MNIAAAIEIEAPATVASVRSLQLKTRSRDETLRPGTDCERSEKLILLIVIMFNVLWDFPIKVYALELLE
jgi:hypothetical protein